MYKESLLTTKPRTDHGASLYDNMQEFRVSLIIRSDPSTGILHHRTRHPV